MTATQFGQRDDLGAARYEAQRDLYAHPTYAVTMAGEPLGILDAWMRARGPRGENGQRGGPKESLPSIEGYG